MYDYNGMYHLLAACLDNIRNKALEAEIEVIGWSLGPEQSETLLKLAEAAKQPPPLED